MSRFWVLYPHNPSVSFADARTREQVGLTLILGDLSGFRGVLDQFQGCSALPEEQRGVAGESITLTVLRLNWQLLARSLRFKPWYAIYIESLSPEFESPNLKDGRMLRGSTLICSLEKISRESRSSGVSAFPEPFWGIESGLEQQHMISVIRQRAHVLGNLILMGFASLKTRIGPPFPEWCHFEIWSIWERNTKSGREKYISTNRWQIQSQVVRNTIQRTSAVILVWTEIHGQLQIAVQMQFANIQIARQQIQIQAQIQIQTQIQIRSDHGDRTIVREIKFWWILAFTECNSVPPFQSYDSLNILYWGPSVWLEASQQMKNWKNLNFWQNSNL